MGTDHRGMDRPADLLPAGALDHLFAHLKAPADPFVQAVADAMVAAFGPPRRRHPRAEVAAARLAPQLAERGVSLAADEHRAIADAVGALLTAIAAEQPGFDWTAERTADAVDDLTKLVAVGEQGEADHG